MNKTFAKSAAAALALCGVATAQSAQAACWSPAAVEAAQVRDLETMLMVSALRCRRSGDNFLPKYNAFVLESKSALTAANDAIRGHFAPLGGLNAYDSYVTSVANRYGAGAEGLGCDDMASILGAARAEGGSYEGLKRLAKVADVQPRLPGLACKVSVARR